MELKDKASPTLYGKRAQFVKELQKINLLHLLAGTLLIMKKTCGNKGCHCHNKGEGHPALYLSFGKKLTFLPQPAGKSAREYNTNYKKLKELIEKITICNLQLLKRRSHGKSNHRKTKPAL